MFKFPPGQTFLLNRGAKAAVEALVIQSKVEDSSIRDPYCIVVDSVVRTSVLDQSSVIESNLKDTFLFSSTVNKGVVLNSTLYDSYAQGTLKYVTGKKVTIVGGMVLKVDLPEGTHIEDGLWTRPPHRVVAGNFPYDITESVDDQILVGCYSRSAAKWLQTTEAAAARIGLSKQQWIDYIKAIEDVALFKALNRSPRSLKGN